MWRANEASESLKSTNDTLIKSKASLERTLKDLTIDSNKRISDLEKNLAESQEVVKELNQKLSGKFKIDWIRIIFFFRLFNINHF